MAEGFDVYAQGTYDQVLGTGLVGKQWRHIHRLIERPFRSKHFDRILEVGAGVGEHLAFVESTWSDYYVTDIRIGRLQGAELARAGIHIEAADVQSLPYDDASFDRVIVTCLLPHVADPVQALHEIHRVARPGARISIYLPCEPGIMLRAARAVTTIPKNHRAHVPDPYYWHFREHVHYYAALNHYLRREFADAAISARYYPFPMFSWNVNLFKIFQISIS